jgi:hypothetical protein
MTSLGEKGRGRKALWKLELQALVLQAWQETLGHDSHQRLLMGEGLEIMLTPQYRQGSVADLDAFCGRWVLMSF